MTKNREATPVLVGILLLVVLIFAAMSILNRKQPSHTTTVTTRIVHVYPPDPATHDTNAGLIAADQEWWKGQVALEAKTSRYPTWLLGYRIEGATKARATVDDYTVSVLTGGKQVAYSALSVNFRWNGQRWVQQGHLFVESLGTQPTAYAQFSPLP